MKATEARQICQEFANKHKVIFEDEGKCGFGRECVGFKTENWINHNPMHAETYEPIAGTECGKAHPPEKTPDAYHKHDCLAVLGRGDDAIIQLAEWVVNMNASGDVEIVDFDTGAKGVQALFSGLTGKTVVIR